MLKQSALGIFSLLLSTPSMAFGSSPPNSPPNNPPPAEEPVTSRMPTDPVSGGAAFLVLPNGKSLTSIRVSGSGLSLARGSGTSFGSSAQAAYRSLKQASQAETNHKVQWVFMDLDRGRVIEQSRSPNKRIFGASSSKVFVGATLLDKQKGDISSSQLQLMADMLVVSSNSAWTTLQTQIGDGNSDRGRQRNYAFTQRMGYPKTHGFQGWWDDLHGNELTAAETADFLYDTYQGRYEGAETLWKLMHTCRTGASRGRKYLPTSIYVGGKTGTYSGPTYDTDIGDDVDVRIANHIIFFNAGGREYGLVVLANTGSDESAALLAGGLYQEHVLGRRL
jgi:hypothetical protein